MRLIIRVTEHTVLEFPVVFPTLILQLFLILVEFWPVRSFADGFGSVKQFLLLLRLLPYFSGYPRFWWIGSWHFRWYVSMAILNPFMLTHKSVFVVQRHSRTVCVDDCALYLERQWDRSEDLHVQNLQMIPVVATFLKYIWYHILCVCRESNWTYIMFMLVQAY